MELSQRFPLLSVLTESNLFSPLSILSPVFFFDRVQIGKDLRTLAGPPYVRAGAAGGGEAGGQGRLTLSTALREPPPPGASPPPAPSPAAVERTARRFHLVFSLCNRIPGFRRSATRLGYIS